MKKLKKILILALVKLTFMSSVTAFGNPVDDLDITGTAVILVERASGRVLYERNPDMPIYPASMITMMTAIILLEHAEPEDILRVNREIYYTPFGASIAAHVFGDHISVHNLLRGIILQSGSDTANVIVGNVARIVTGETLPFAEAEALFVELMNEKARELGAYNTNFTNAHGFHDENMTTTVRDLSIIAGYATDIPIINEIARELYFVGPTAEGEGLQVREINWQNTNRLLFGEFFNPDVTGLKTGFHTPAGWCLAATGYRDGMELITIIAGSYDRERWVDTTALMNYAFDNYITQLIHTSQSAVSEIDIYNPRWGDESRLEVVGTRDFSYLLSDAELSRIVTTIQWNEDLMSQPQSLEFVAPFTAGDIMGQVVYTLDGRELFRDNLVITADVEEWSYGASLVYVVNFLRENPFSIFGLSFLLAVIFLLIVIVKFIAFIIRVSNYKSKDRAYR